MSYTCPACGYPGLTTDPAYIASFEICPSCHFHFGYTDRDQGFTHDQWRKKWIEGGMVWDKGKSTPPSDWNPQKQLQNIGVKLPPH